MNWNFRDDMDHIFDVIRKTSDVIKSCENNIQLKGAKNYLKNLENYLSHFESNKKQKEFIEMQLAEFRKMIRIKKRAYDAAFD